MIKKGRIIIHNEQGYQEVSIRLIRNAYVIIPLAVCALVWMFGLIFLGDKVLQTYRTIIEMGIAGMLFFWLILGAAIFSTLHWIFSGKEKIVVTVDHIQTEKPIHLYKRRRVYPLTVVSDIGMDVEVYKVKRNGQWEDDQRVVIRFETPNKSVTFGRGLTNEEAEFILLELAKNENLNETHFRPVSKS